MAFILRNLLNSKNMEFFTSLGGKNQENSSYIHTVEYVNETNPSHNFLKGAHCYSGNYWCFKLNRNFVFSEFLLLLPFYPHVFAGIKADLS